ncbi:MAG TPA: hypothetical protein VIR57_23960 [Chloroflexota bacterium]|jgi:hypothetical protein
MNPKTMKIYDVPAGEEVKPGHIALAKYEAEELRPMNRAQRRQWLREHRAGFAQPKAKRHGC